MEKNKEEMTLFWNGPFSQWYPSNFTLGGVKYNCAEQAMMHLKALYFADFKTAEEIMKTDDPKTQKKLGRGVDGFDVEKWKEVAKKYVTAISYAKFNQNPLLKKELLDTRYRTLVEASPYDAIWGIGLGEEDPRAWDRNSWKGLNWLGECLMKARDLIIFDMIDSNCANNTPPESIL